MRAVLGSPENTVTSTLEASDPCQESSAVIWGGSCQQISAMHSTECTQSTRANVWLQRGPTAESPAIKVELTLLKDKPSLLILQKSARRIFREIAQELYHKRYVETCQQPVSIKQQKAQCRSKDIKKYLQQAVNNQVFLQKTLSQSVFIREPLILWAKAFDTVFNSQRPPSQ